MLDARKPFGEFIKKARELSGKTQAEVSEALGYSSAQFISNMERGITATPLKVVRPLAKLIGVKPRELYEAWEKVEIVRMREAYKLVRKAS